MGPILIVAFLGAIFMAISIGASSVSPAFAPVNSSSSIGLRLSLVAGISALIGAVLQGGNVASTVGSGVLVGNIQLIQGATILIVASLLVIVSVLFDYPMPTAFTVIGAVLGSSLAFGNGVIWSSTSMIVAFWFLTPLAAVALGYVLARLMRKTLSKEDSEDIISIVLFLAGTYVAYTAGAASVGLAVGPLESLGQPMVYLLLLGGGAILVGAWMFSPRIIHVVSYDYSNIGPRRSASALLASGLIAQVGIQLGVPVSFNLAIIAGVIGSGLVESAENKDTEKIGFTVLGWVSAFFLAGLLTFLLGWFWQWAGIV